MPWQTPSLASWAVRSTRGRSTIRYGEMHDHSTSPKGPHGLRLARRAIAAATLVGIVVTAGCDAEIGSPQAATAIDRGETLVASVPVRAEPASLKLGTVRSGTPISGLIKLVNASDRPIGLAKVSASCGCTAVAPAAQIIPPASSVEVSVELRASARPGASLRKTITVVFEDDIEPLRIPIRGKR